MRSPKPRLLRSCLGLGALVLAVLAVEAGTPPVAIYDEGVVLASVFRFAAGELPWRDYDPVYGVLEPLFLWPTVRAFGAELLALRLERAVFAAVALALLAATVLRTTGARAAALVAAAAIARRASVLVHPALPLLVATAWLLDRAVGDGSAPSKSRARGLFFAGCAAGATGLARLEFGALAALAGALALVLVAWARRRAARNTARDIALFAAGGVPALLGLAALVALAGWERVAAHFEAMGALVQHRSEGFPLPPPEGTHWMRALDMFLVFGAPLVVIPLALLVTLFALARDRRGAARTDEPRAPLPVALVLAGVGTLPYALSRPDLLHFVPPYAIACALAAIPLGRLEQRLAPRPRALAALAALALVVVPLALRANAALALRGRPDHAVSTLPGVRGVALPAAVERTWRGAVEAVQRRVPPHEALFVGCARHDRVHINDGLLYVLCRRPIATRHHCFNPGVTTSVEKQRAIVRDLESSSPRSVVLIRGLGPTADGPRGAQILDRWLSRRYARVESFGGYEVYARR